MRAATRRLRSWVPIGEWAQVLSTFLQACDIPAILGNLQRVPVPPTARPECFPAGTQVTIADGSRKSIERIRVGQLVLSFDEATNALVPGRVERTFIRQDADSLVVVNGALFATPNHPFYTQRGWVLAGLLRDADRLVGLHDAKSGIAARVEPDEVRTLTVVPTAVTTFNLRVAHQHNYFAGGFLVHDGP